MLGNIFLTNVRQYANRNNICTINYAYVLNYSNKFHICYATLSKNLIQ